MGVIAKGDPTVWKIVEGKLYLNCRPEIMREWEKDIQATLKRQTRTGLVYWSRPGSENEQVASHEKGQKKKGRSNNIKDRAINRMINIFLKTEFFM